MNLWKIFSLIMIGLLIIVAGIRFEYVETHIFQPHIFQLNEQQTGFAISKTSNVLNDEIDGRDYLTIAVRFLLGLILMILSFRAFLKTRASAMFYLTMGFTLITVGNLFSTIYYINDLRMDRFLANIFDILGLIALIIAVEKS